MKTTPAPPIPTPDSPIPAPAWPYLLPRAVILVSTVVVLSNSLDFSILGHSYRLSARVDEDMALLSPTLPT